MRWAATGGLYNQGRRTGHPFWPRRRQQSAKVVRNRKRLETMFRSPSFLGFHFAFLFEKPPFWVSSMMRRQHPAEIPTSCSFMNRCLASSLCR
jgi:hypothetical protein